MATSFVIGQDPRRQMSFLVPEPPKRPVSLLVDDTTSETYDNIVPVDMSSEIKSTQPAVSVSDLPPISNEIPNAQPVAQESNEQTEQGLWDKVKGPLSTMGSTMLQMVGPGGVFDAVYWDTNSPIGRILNRSRTARQQNALAQIQQMNAYAQLMNASRNRGQASGTYGKLVDDMMAKGYSFDEADRFARDYLMKQGGVNISLGEKGINEVSTDRLKTRAKAIDESARIAMQTLPAVDRLLEANARGELITGGGPIGAAARKFASDLGFTDAAQAQNRADMMKAYGAQMAAIINAQNVGSISDSERANFERQAPNFGNSVKENVAILTEFQRLLQKAKNEQKTMNEYIGKYDNPTDVLRYLDEYNNSVLEKERSFSRSKTDKPAVMRDTKGRLYRLTANGDYEPI